MPKLESQSETNAIAEKVSLLDGDLASHKDCQGLRSFVVRNGEDYESLRGERPWVKKLEIRSHLEES